MKSQKKPFRPFFNHGGAQIEFLGSLDWLQVAIGLWERLDMQRRSSFMINFLCFLEKQPKEQCKKSHQTTIFVKRATDCHKRPEDRHITHNKGAT